MESNDIRLRRPRFFRSVKKKYSRGNNALPQEREGGARNSVVFFLTSEPHRKEFDSLLASS